MEIGDLKIRNPNMVPTDSMSRTSTVVQPYRKIVNDCDISKLTHIQPQVSDRSHVKVIVDIRRYIRLTIIGSSYHHSSS